MSLIQNMARNLTALMVDSTSHVTGLAGLTLTITASKNGGAFASITPTVTDLGSGWYSLALTAAHTNTLGDLTIQITATGADPTSIREEVSTITRSVAAGTSVSGTTTTMVDAARTEADADYWKGCLIVFTSGSIAGQVRLITGFTPGSDTITFTPATTQAVSTQTYEIMPWGGADLWLWNGTAVNNTISGRVDSSVGAMAANVLTAAAINASALTAAKFATDAVDSNAVAASAVTKIQAGLATAANLALVQTDVDDLQARTPAALVGGRTDASVGAIAAGALTGTAIATSGVTKIRSVVNGTASSGSTTTLVDAGRVEADTDYWKGLWLLVTSGSSSGQVRLITGFNAATDTITFAPALTQAISTNTYEILPAGSIDLRLWAGSTPNALISGRVDANAQVVGAGAITAASHATDAVDANALAASAVTKIQSGLATSAALATVQSDTDDLQTRIPSALVGGRMDSSIGAVVANAITGTGIATSAVTKLRSLANGTASSGSTTTLVDAARVEADTDYWKGAWLLITSGTASGQVRLITGFNAATDTLTFAPALTQAVSTNTYEILPAGGADVRLWAGSAPNALISGRVDANAQAIAAALITAATFAADAIDANALATTGVNEIRDALLNATVPELAQATPSATPSLVAALGLLYMAIRNDSESTATARRIKNNAGTVIAKSTMADAAGVFNQGQLVSGP